MTEVFVNIAEGRIQNFSAVQRLVASLKDGRYKVTIEKAKKRSNSQNAYYWACIVPMVMEGLRDMGWGEFETSEDVHEFLKLKFLRKEIVGDGGEIIETIGSTKKLSTVEFGEYMEKIAMWAAEYLNIVIPPPAGQAKLYQ